ncbi:carboxymuconolactone decarboxylase family protein [Cellulomonas sp. Y8]|uniref:carboxymuconolactone decarboxylase family protein n=1 Tax=Cellulomonas sp. Y8 TaxID=2591145 RepID=UPI0011CA5F58|nr:carboxymuconolactone decarboxylase family protein [Cellulomonas sp. Y8]
MTTQTTAPAPDHAQHTDGSDGPDRPVRVPRRLDVDGLAPTFSAALADLDAAATAELDRAGVEPALREIVRLRASQLNGCAYCVDTHARDARAAGLRTQQVDAVAVWRESSFFTARQRAALELAESVTLAPQTRVPGEVVAAATAASGEQATAALLALVVAINAWNLVGVTARCWSAPVVAD